jgi:plastocyanin
MFVRSLLMLSILSMISLALPVWANVDTVTVQDFRFTPATLNISQGDTVIWHCINGTHNVHQTDTPEFFYSGVPTGATWYYTFIFNVPANTYHYRCDQHPSTMLGTIVVEPLSVPDLHIAVTPGVATLSQNYPNPFNSRTQIEFTLPYSSKVRLTVLNILGEQIGQLFTGVAPAGRHIVSFDANGLTSGVYFYRLETPSGVLIRTMRYLK